MQSEGGEVKGENILAQYREFLRGRQLSWKWILLFILLPLRVFAAVSKDKEVSSDMYVMF